MDHDCRAVQATKGGGKFAKVSYCIKPNLDNYDIKQTENRSATKKEVALPKYHPGKQTLKSASSRGRSLGAGDRRSKGRNSACSLESHGSHNSNRSRPRHMVQPVRTRSRENIRIYEEER